MSTYDIMFHYLVRLIQKYFHVSDRKSTEIAPDEIFLDAYNLPDFDESQFEGRIESPIRKRTLNIFYFGIIALGLVLILRTGDLQIRDGDFYVALSERNRLAHSVLFAARGVMYDRNGTELAWNEDDAMLDFPKRVYADRSGLAHTVGYLQYPLKDISGVYYQKTFVGLAGAEEAFEKTLGGVNGLKIIETDALSDVVSESVLRRPKNGGNVTLSTDARVEEALYGFLKETADRVSFEGGAGVIMDVSNGEVLALVSFPEYNPNAILRGDEEVIRSYRKDERKPFINRVVSGLYAPGSIVKPFIALGALAEDIITPEKKIESTGSIKVPNPYVPDEFTVFRDWKAHGWVDMRDALAVSSDVYFYVVGGGYEDQKGLGIANIETYMRLFGFGDETGINVGIEEIGTIPSPAWKKETFEDGVWRIGNTYHTAIGQYGFSVTPIQVVRAVAAIANGGNLVKPTLIFGDGATERSRITIAPEHWSVVKEGMRAAVERGTAQGLYLPNVSIAAKTGTAELGITKKYVNSWVIGFFPYEKPRFAFAVVMERGPADNLVGALSVMRQMFLWMAVHTPEYLD